MIYLDNNATTRPAPEVMRAMRDADETLWANPSSVHRAGQAVRARVELARSSVARLVGALDREIVFTSGGTEAANLAVRGALAMQPERRVLVTSRLEHSAVRELAESLAGQGVEVVMLGNDEDGLVDVEALENLLARRSAEIALVSVMWVNNETGVVQPVEAMGAACRRHGVRYHTDATQAVGKRPVDVSSLPVDLMSFAAHKLHGPTGVGALYVRRGLRLAPQVVGGPQERLRRGGTENVSGIIGFGVAADLAREWLVGDGAAAIGELRDRLERSLARRLDGVTVHGDDAPRLWSTSCIAFEGLEAEPILLMLSERGVCVSAGAACSSGSVEPSHVLQAMGVPPEVAEASIRFSLSRETTVEEIDEAVEIVVEVIDRLRELALG